MSLITNSQITNIQFQGGVYSRPLRTNFENLKNAHNDLESRVSALATPPVGSEVTDARDNAAVLRDRLRGASKAHGNVVISGLVVSQASPADLTVKISAGEALVDGVYCLKSAETTTATIAVAAANTRYSVVVMNSDNTISVVAGSDSATPVLPVIASTQRPLAILTLPTGTTQIQTSNILDVSETVFPQVLPRFLHSSTADLNDIYNLISPYVPVVNDVIQVVGVFFVVGAPSKNYSINHAKRTAWNQITLYGTIGGNAVDSYEILSTDSGTLPASLSILGK